MIGLLLLLLLHLGLSVQQAYEQRGLPLLLHHQTYTRVLDQVPYITGEDRWLLHTDVEGARAPFPERPLDRHSEAGWFHDLRDGRHEHLWVDGYGHTMAWTYLLPGLVALFFPGHPLWVWLAPQLFLALLLMAVYGIGRRCHSSWVGLAAAAVASGYPAVFGFARTHNDGVPLAAGAFLAIWMLMESQGLTRLGYALLAGLALGAIQNLGENASGSVITYAVVAGPALLQLGTGLRQALRTPRRSWRLPLGLGLVVAPPLLAFRWARLDAISAYLATGSGHNLAWPAGMPTDEATIRLTHATAYLWQMAGDLVRPPLLAWGALGLLLILIPATRSRFRWTVLLSFLVPLVIVTLIPRKSSWYLTPALPGLALISVVGLQALPGRWLRGAAMALVGLTGLICLLVLSLGPDALRFGLLGEQILAERNGRMGQDINLPPPHWEGEKQRRLGQTAREVGDRLDALLPPEGRRRWIALVQPTGHAGWEMAYHLELRRPDLRVMPVLRLEDEHWGFGDPAYDASLYDIVVCVDMDNALTACDGSLWPVPDMTILYSLEGCKERDRVRRLIPGLRDRPTLDPIPPGGAPP